MVRLLMTGNKDDRKSEERDTTRPAEPAPGDDSLKRRLDALSDTLSVKAVAEAAKRADSEPKTGYAQAFKLSSEFIAGIVAGGGIGFLIDTLAGTTPWGLIIFLLLGFVAGVLNVLRSAGMVAEVDRRIKPDE